METYAGLERFFWAGFCHGTNFPLISETEGVRQLTLIHGRPGHAPLLPNWLRWINVPTDHSSGRFTRDKTKPGRFTLVVYLHVELGQAVRLYGGR